MKYLLTLILFTTLLLGSCDDTETTGPNTDGTTEVEDTTLTQSSVSLVITLDRSASMNVLKPELNGASGKELTAQFLDIVYKHFPFNRGEIGLTAFSSGTQPSLIAHSFSSDTASLMQAYHDIIHQGQTDYNKAFMGDSVMMAEGAFKLAETANNPVHILFLTDGKHTADEGEFKFSEIIEYATANNITIHPISVLNPLSPEMWTIADMTDGLAAEGLTSADELENFYLQVMEKISE
jgi:hypothetical protein